MVGDGLPVASHRQVMSARSKPRSTPDRRATGVHANWRCERSHARIMLITKGPQTRPRRRFTGPPGGTHTGRTGHQYATDLWGLGPSGRQGRRTDLVVTVVAHSAGCRATTTSCLSRRSAES